ncbi:MAG TPA: SIMPL domain-containing protein [Gemmatimonadaceae bacterium]|jgi:hypothetical protein
MRNRLLVTSVMAGMFAVPLAGPFAMPLVAQTSNVALPQIVTTGVGEARVTPDRATIMIGVQTRGSTAAAAGADNARKQKAILDTLKALGLGADQLSTTGYNVWPEMSQTTSANQTPRVVAYTVSNTVRVELRRIEDVGKTIDAALSKGANEISSLQFTSSKADSVRRAALAAAVANARADAQALATAAGGTLGQLIEISTTSSPVRPVMFDARMEMSAKAAVPTSIEPGEQTVNATVTVRWGFVGR